MIEIWVTGVHDKRTTEKTEGWKNKNKEISTQILKLAALLIQQGKDKGNYKHLFCQKKQKNHPEWFQLLFRKSCWFCVCSCCLHLLFLF